MLIKGCIGYFAIVDTTIKVVTELSNVCVVYKFPDVFLKELSRLPPNREIEFEIELQPRTALISKAPYRMAPAVARITR